MSVEENKARYEHSALRVLMERSGHTVCDRCYCCDSTMEAYTCWQCGGFADEDDDEWRTHCSVCDEEGKVYVRECLGRCDEDGNHKPRAVSSNIGQSCAS